MRIAAVGGDAKVLLHLTAPSRRLRRSALVMLRVPVLTLVPVVEWFHGSWEPTGYPGAHVA